MQSALRSTLAGLALAILFSPLALAQLDVKRIYPPAATHGEATLRAEGKFPNWPVQVFSDRTDVQVTCGAESGVLNVNVSPDCPPGVCWLRLADDKAISQLFPIVVGATPVLTEVEPKSEFDVAAFQQLACPTLLAGKLAKSGDSDSYRVELSRGDRIQVKLLAHNLLQSPMDAVLQIADLEGNVLAQNDDEQGLDPALFFQSPEQQTCLIRIFAFPSAPNSTIGFAGGEDYVYLLQVERGDSPDHFLPLVACQEPQPIAFQATPSDSGQHQGLAAMAGEVKVHRAGTASPATAYLANHAAWQWLADLSDSHWPSVIESVASSDGDSPLTPPVILSGHIASRDEVDRYALTLRSGTKFRAKVVSREFGFGLDSVMSLVDATGNVLASSDDISRTDYDSKLEYTPKQDQVCWLEVRDAVGMFGLRHAYSVVLEAVEPQAVVTVASDRFQLSQGGSLEIPISVNREDGFAATLQLEVVGLPSGVEASSTEVTKDTKSPVNLKLVAAPDAAPFQGPIRIIARQLQAEKDTSDAESQSAAWQTEAAYALRPGVRLRAFHLAILAKP